VHAPDQRAVERVLLRAISRSPTLGAMIRFVFGAILGGALATGGGWLWLEHTRDCALRCGDGTVCFSGRCLPRNAPTTVVTLPGKDTHQRRR